MKRYITFSILFLAAILFSIPVYASDSADETVTLRVPFPEAEGFTMKKEDGTRYGLVVDYLNEIAKYTDWEYEYIDADGDTMMEEFVAGKYDLMGGTYYSPALEEYFVYPEYSCGSSKSVILARWDDDSIRGYDYADFNGKTIGVYERAVENQRRLKEFFAMNNVECTIRTFAVDEMIDGDLDAYLENGELDLLLGNASDNNGKFRAVADFDAQPHYIVTAPGNQEILDGLNMALTHIMESNPKFAKECYDRNFPDAGNNMLVLSDEEKAYVRQKGTVTVAIPQKYHPFYCMEDEDGEHNGIVPDILSQVTEFSGLEFSYVHTDTYAGALKLVNSGKADVLGFFLGGESDAAEAGLALTKSYTALIDLVVRNKSVTYPAEGLTCAIQEGRVLPSNIQGKVVRFATSYDALSAVNRGEADFAYGLSAQMESEMQRNIFSNLVPVSVIDQSNNISFALSRPAEANLLTIFNKAINSISSTQKEVIRDANLVSIGKTSSSLRNLIYSNPVYAVSVVTAFLLLVVIIITILYINRIRSLRIRSELVKAEATSRAKSQFLSQMSHEIRTPLNGVIGMAELSRKHVSDPDRMLKDLDKIQSSSKHLLALINDVLDMSKIESGRIELHEETFNFGILLRSLQASFLPQAKEKGITYELNLYGPLEEILTGDSLRLNQIITNLLSNAMKFTPTDGKVLLSVKELRREESTIWIAFEVSDTGCGIEAENRERIFLPFEQEYAGTARQYGGTGLGLPITKNFVEMMGGTISVTSHMESGSCFRVELPFVYKHVEMAPCGNCQEVLVIHSASSARTRLNDLLQRQGFLVDALETTEQAKSMIEASVLAGTPYDFCLLEWNLDHAGDMEAVVAGFCKAGGDILKVILVGFACEELEDAAKMPGVKDILFQPVFQSDLVSALKGCKSEPSGSGAPTLGGCFTGLNFLVVEDNEINMEVALGLLEDTGAKLDHAYNGREAVERFQESEEGHYDLILMDMQMPVMDGLSATKAIRALPRSDAGTILIFAMTANAMSEDARICLESGMNAHIGKPFELEDIYRHYREEKGQR